LASAADKCDFDAGLSASGCHALGQSKLSRFAMGRNPSLEGGEFLASCAAV